MLRHSFKPTLEENINATSLIEVNKGQWCLVTTNHVTVMHLDKSSEVLEHLGYFHNLSKAIKQSYQKCLDEYEKHYRKLLNDAR